MRKERLDWPCSSLTQSVRQHPPGLCVGVVKRMRVPIFPVMQTLPAKKGRTITKLDIDTWTSFYIIIMQNQDILALEIYILIYFNLKIYYQSMNLN